jgi:hypothetical protein
MNLWSEKEVKLIRELYPQGKAEEIAKRTGRSLESVKHKAYSLGVKTRVHRPWSDGKIKQLRKIHPGETVDSIATKLGRTTTSVRSKIRELKYVDECTRGTKVAHELVGNKPREGKSFRAYLRVECIGKEHHGSPFRCNVIDMGHGKIEATDAHGLACVLKFNEFRFGKYTGPRRKLPRYIPKKVKKGKKV